MAIERGTLRGHHWALLSGEHLPKYLKAKDYMLVFSYAEVSQMTLENFADYARDIPYLVASQSEIDDIIPNDSYVIVYHAIRRSTLSKFKAVYPIPSDIEGDYIFNAKNVFLGVWTEDKKGMRVMRKRRLSNTSPVHEEVDAAFAWARRLPPPPNVTAMTTQTSTFVNYLLATMRPEERQKVAKELLEQSSDKNAIQNHTVYVNGACFSGKDIVEVKFSKPKTADVILVKIQTVNAVITTNITTITIETCTTLPDSAISGLKGRALDHIIDEPWAKGMKIQSAKRKQVKIQGKENAGLSITARHDQEMLAKAPGKIPDVAIDYKAKYRRVLDSVLDRGFLLRKDIVNAMAFSDDERRALLACTLASMKPGTDYFIDQDSGSWTISLQSDVYSVETAPLVVKRDNIYAALGAD